MSSSDTVTTGGTLPPKRQATTLEDLEEEEAKDEVQTYSFFNRRLKEEANKNGDIYDEKLSTTRKEWAIPSVPSYLQHVKSLSSTWPTLGLLADFMEIGTSPMRWEKLKGRKNEQARQERVSRTEVTRLDYMESGEIVPQQYQTSESLKNALAEETDPKQKRNFRLFVVEDLSREVIEMLGSKFDIEPHFFREHIFDYAWYNTRDRWAYPPRFNMLVRKQRWMQLRFTTARYFRTAASFKKATGETERFNVYRRTEDDTNNRATWDEKDAKVGISRTRTSFWSSHEDVNAGDRVGILLVDPTIQEGFPLWYGYGNWEETPSMHDTQPVPTPPTRKSFYDNIIYWAQKPEAVGYPDVDASSFPQVPIQAILYLVASEWLIMSEYIKTRLGQIEWEISYPEHFLARESNIDVPLKKLHIWRRLVPLYREMLNETLQGVFKYPCHTMGTLNIVKTTNTQPPNTAVINSHQSNMSGPKGVTQEEFARALSYMEEYQLRIERLTSVVTAIISIGDSRHSQEDNRNVARLTWLATFFIPLTFVSGLFSMTEDVRTLGDTFKWFAAAAIPLALISVGMGVVLTLPFVQKWVGGKIKGFDEWYGANRLRLGRKDKKG